MKNEILYSLLTIISSLIGTFGGVMSGMKLMNYKITQLDEKVAKLEKKFDQYVIEPKLRGG